MRILKNSKGEVVGVSTNDEPARKKGPRGPEPITTQTVRPPMREERRRKAAADAEAANAAATKVEAEKKAVQNAKA